MGLFSNEVDKSEIQPGDHVYSYRKLHMYSHHGICVEADRVIHYNRTKVASNTLQMLESKTLQMLRSTRSGCKNCGHHPNMARGVIKTCVDCFLHHHSLYRCEYGVSPAHLVMKFPGTCTTGHSDSADNVIRRATDLLNNKEGFGDYNLFENNCESFAIFCKTGKRMSGQAFAAINAFEILFKALVKHNVDRLLQDVSVHHPDKYMQLKQTIDTPVNLPAKEMIATLKLLDKDFGNDQEDVNDEDVLDDNDEVQIMD